MARVDILQMLYSKDKNPLNFSFENLKARPLLSLLTPQDIYQLYKIATSIRLSSKPKEKYKLIDNILVPRGFKYVASGTNRVVYKYLDDNSICIKVALDKVGLSDNPNELRNQYLLEPFVTKVFEVSPCGTVGLFERVNPITSREEYKVIADDVFKLITVLVGKYVLGDIGTNYFQNIGVRTGFGVVLLDFPYVYELDGNKLFCNMVNPITGMICGGEIDYDDGFNKLICTKCHKEYFPKQLEKDKKENRICIKEEGESNMKIVIKQDNKIINKFSDIKSSDTIPVIEKEENPFDIKINDPKQIESDIAKETTMNENTSINDYKMNVTDSYKKEDKEEEISGISEEESTSSLDTDIKEVDDIKVYYSDEQTKETPTDSNTVDISDAY